MDNLTPDQIKQMIQMLSNMLPQDDAEEHENSVIKSKSINTKKKRVNKFDSMAEKNMHKADSEIDKKLSVQPLVPRNRSYVPVDVTCRVCGKKDQVNPGLISDSVERYKCNKCSSMAG
jgi:hypothetical protein